MNSVSSRNEQYMDLLSKLMFQGYTPDFRMVRTDLDSLNPELEQIFGMSEDHFREFLELADTHHVTVRALRLFAPSLQRSTMRPPCRSRVSPSRCRLDMPRCHGRSSRTMT